MNKVQSNQINSTSCKKKHRGKRYNHIDNNTRKELLELVIIFE